ncbi:hypothetical protein PHYSODRAFT_295586 [Phytophthora sojae]|uniref:Uncharacterized protein n=1 Tax=Phytophthora sojae (strain P6497) TaxID=1094619 RepID=G4YT94_PHYSP|nr:hypothetical protein PHYSODRAFT_295586 [Phytophthora sojae]EGZ23016.1 hypothetical protein PHYSODRAFT_295586 [Phytophthora sojae]|eukprot:XP_009518304.1 hypothetical protein PHYSODRAFT_295586 [Phytophthora sojae]
MVSYRRQSNVCRRKRENAQDLGATQALDENAEGPTGGAATDEREPSASQSEDIDRAGFATAQALRSMVPERATSHLQVDAECDGAVTFQADSRAFDELGAADDDEAGNPFSSIPPLGQESPCCHFCLGPLLEPPHARQDTMERLQLMLLVLLFMRSTPLGDFSFHFSKMDSQIRRNWLSNLSQFEQLRQGEESSAHELLTHIRSSFSLAYFVSKRSHSDVGHSGREQAVLRSCANLLFDAFSSTRVQQILESASVTQVDERGQERTVPGSCEHFGHLIADLFDELTSLLDNRSDPRAAALSRDDINYGHSTIPHIVDDILSLVYAAPKYRSLRTTTSALLLRKNDALETAARRLFRACELQQAWNSSIQRLDRCSDSTPADHARDQPDVQQEKAVHNLPTPSNDKWTGRWFLEPTSISITPVSSQMGADYGSAMTLATGPSLLSVLGLIRIFASIDLALENLQLSVGSSIRGTGRKRAVFVLDGQAHPIKTLPNDVVVAAGVALFGDCWGLNEYQGRVSDDRISIDLLLLVKTSSRHSDRIGASSFDQRVYLHVALEDERDGEKGFSVSAEITTEWGTPSRQHSRLSNVHGLSCSSTLKAHSVFVGTA